jgi:hypothetical protein
MKDAYGTDFGLPVDCRVCRCDRFTLNRGNATIDDKPVSTLVIRCARCGTIYDILQVDWTASPDFSKEKVVINDGIEREPGFQPKQESPEAKGGVL